MTYIITGNGCYVKPEGWEMMWHNSEGLKWLRDPNLRGWGQRGIKEEIPIIKLVQEDHKLWPTDPIDIIPQNAPKSIPCLGGQLVINNEIKELIEKFEPNKHQFIPVEFYDYNKKLLPIYEYYLLVAISGFSAPHPNYGKYNTFHPNYIKNPEGDGYIPDPNWVKPNKFPDCHIWREQLINGKFFASDELAKEWLKINPQNETSELEFYYLKNVTD